MRALAIPLALLIATTAVGETPREKLARLAADYGIEIQVLDRDTNIQRDGYNVTGKPVSDELLTEYEPMFEREWRRYPVSLMAKVHLKRIVIGANVRVLDQPRASVPEFAPGWFWLDAEVNSRRPNYGVHALHHDFFHMIDEWDTPNGRQDPGWKALDDRPEGPGGWNMQKKGVGALRTDIPGYITQYATAAVEEDKAEVYGHLLSSPWFILGRAAMDPILAKKVARIKALIAAFEPAMGPDWWPKLKPVP